MPIPVALVSTVALFLASFSPPPAAVGGQSGPCSALKTVTVNDSSLRYVECGRGDLLVFVHGGFGDVDTFRRQLEPFAESFHVVAYSRRFHPPNAPPGADDVYSMANQADDLVGLIRSFGGSPAHVVAHSYGAYVALTAALAHPELVRTLVLGEPPILSLLEVTSVGRSVRDAFVAHALDPARAAFERDRPEEAIGAFLDGISAVPWFGQLPAEQRRGFLRFAPEFRLEMLSARSAYLPPIPCESLSTLQRPVLLLTGEQSPSVFQLVTAELERCLEGESHQAIPGVGHGMHQNAERYNRAVLTFLRSR